MLTLITLLATASAGELRQPVMDLLNAHDMASPHEAYAKLGEGVAEELMAIAIDPEVAHSRRARAVSALGHFNTDVSKGFLLARLGDDDALIQRKAAWALAVGWGDQALPVLRPLLAAEDTQLRTATAKAIGSLKTSAGREALEARLSEERDPHVLDALKAGIDTTDEGAKAK